MKFNVVQIGARRGYAVPAILEKHGMLEQFYTDLCADHGLGRLISAGRTFPFVGRKIQKLSTRQLPPEIRAKTKTFALPVLRHGLKIMLGSKDPSDRFREHLRWNDEWGQAMTREGFGNATHIFSMLGEGGSYLIEAKKHNLKVVSEIYILLSSDRILAEERKCFPDWETQQPDYDAICNNSPESNPLLTHSDFAICPSDAVRHDLAENFNFPQDRSAVVPYGMNPRLLDLPPQTRPGRVLFVGTADLRKGIHYLAQAANSMAAKNIACEFRVAGNVSSKIAEKSDCRHLHFLGRIPREQVAEEYQQADLFVLPSLAEGSAEVTYEALAAGLPVITTHAAGSVVRDGSEGKIVPERDPLALADAIEELLVDRALRDRMAAAARERAREFTWDRYGDRLIAALLSMS